MSSIALLLALFAVAPGAFATLQTPADSGLVRGAAENERGDFYQATLTLNEVVRRLEKDPRAARDLALAHAHLAWASHELNQPEQAEAEVRSALLAYAGLVVGEDVFPEEIVSLFDRARRPPSPDPEAAGRLAMDEGRPQEAFLEFLQAIRGLKDPRAVDVETRLRREIIEAVGAMSSSPPVPEEARRRLDLTNAMDTESAQSELQAVARLAPWWPEPLFRLSKIQQRLARPDDAAATLGLYKLADLASRPHEAARPDEPTPVVVAPSLGQASTMGMLIIYWSPQFKGAGRPKIRCEGAHMADLAKGRLIQITASSGLRKVKFLNKETTIRVLPGGTHYLRAAAVGFPAHAEIREVPEGEAQAEIKEKGIGLNEANKTYGTTCGIGKEAGRRSF